MGENVMAQYRTTSRYGSSVEAYWRWKWWNAFFQMQNKKLLTTRILSES